MSLPQRIIRCRAEARPVPEHSIAFDTVFVMHVSAKGWILEKICRAIAANGAGSTKLIYSERNDVITAPLPRARNYVFAHYSIYCNALARHPELHAARLFVWFTHPDFSRGIGAEDLVFALRHAERVFTANAAHAALLGELGVPRARLTTVYGAADPALFHPKRRGGGKVGFVGAYYPRKAPEQILALVSAMPDVQFLLLGPDADAVENNGLLWSNFPQIQALQALPNLEVIETGYAHYPQHFARLDVYVSLSRLEGGPIPLVEALVSNTMPVVTRTGFAEELVTNRVNGYLLPVETTVEDAEAAVRSALADTVTDVTRGTEELSWSGFGRRIAEAMRAPLSGRFDVVPHQDETSRRILKQGWRGPEADGIWQFAPTGMVALPLAAGTHLKRLDLAVEVQPVAPPETLSLGFKLNGVALHAIEVQGGARVTVPFDDLPASLSRANGENFLELRLLSDLAGLPEDASGLRILRLARISGETSVNHPPAAPGIGAAIPAAAGEGPGHETYCFLPDGNGRGLLGQGWRDAGSDGFALDGEEGYVILPVPGPGPLEIRIDLTRPTADAAPCWITATDGDRSIDRPVPAQSGPICLALPFVARSGARLLRLAFEGGGLAVRTIHVAGCATAVADHPVGSPVPA